MARVWVIHDSDLIWEYWKRHPEKRPTNIYDTDQPEAFAENLLSDAVLAKLVERLQHDKKWTGRLSVKGLSADETVTMVRKKLLILLPESRFENRDVFRVCATDHDPDFTAAIANALPDAYNDRYHERIQKIDRNRLEEVEKMFDRKLITENRVEATRAGIEKTPYEMARLVERGIPVEVFKISNRWLGGILMALGSAALVCGRSVLKAQVRLPV